jgi:hypothetical protein
MQILNLMPEEQAAVQIRDLAQKRVALSALPAVTSLTLNSTPPVGGEMTSGEQHTIDHQCCSRSPEVESKRLGW